MAEPPVERDRALLAALQRLAARNPHLRKKKVKDARLGSRTSRTRLAPRREPYWHALEPGLALGYRRFRRGVGTWIARRRDDSGRPRYESLGPADDVGPVAVGPGLSFEAAKAAARLWGRAQATRPSATAAPLTVGEAARLYMADFLMRGKKSGATTQISIDAFILPPFGDRTIESLGFEELRDWLYLLACAPRRLRTKRGRQQRYARMPPLPPDIAAALALFGLAAHATPRPRDDDEAIADSEFDEVEIVEAWRARCATANRVLAVLKAVLNHAFNNDKVASDKAWRRLKPFARVNQPKVRFFEVEERDRFLAATHGAFRDLAAGALVTGCRYSELGRLRVRDFDAVAKTINVEESKGGKPRHIPLATDGAALFAALVEGRAPDERIFRKDDGTPWKKGDQAPPMAAACAAAGIAPAGFHVLRHSFATLLWIEGARIEVIADLLGHADIKITLRHYAHIPRRVVAAAAAALPPLPARP